MAPLAETARRAISTFVADALCLLVPLWLALASTASAQHYTFTVLAGAPGEAGHADGIGGAARFNHPGALALDATGNLYVADTGNHTIRKVTLTGVVTTVAGLAGHPGSADGVGEAARFNGPRGIAVDRAGTIYVADTDNHTIRRIGLDGAVTTIAGLAGVTGSADGAGSSARFNRPWGIAVDDEGAIYVSDRVNYTIRTVTPAGVAATLAGAPGRFGTVDGTGQAARFRAPRGLTMDGATLAVIDDEGIRRVTAGGVVTTWTRLDSSGTYCIPNCPAPGMQGCGVGCSISWSCSISSGSVDVDPEGRFYAAMDTRLGWGCPAARMATATGAARTLVGVPAGVVAVAVDAARNLLVADDTTIRFGVFDPDGDRDGLPDDWEQQYGLSITSAEGNDGAAGNPDADGATNMEEYAADTHPRGFFRQYFAEGATIPPFDTRFAVLAAAPASSCFRFEDRTGRVTTYPLELRNRSGWPGASPAAVRPREIGLTAAEFSTTVESDVQLVVDRRMTWPPDGEAYGAHVESAIAAPSAVWYLAEGATHSGFDLFYLVQNPSDHAVPVEVRYLLPPPLGTVVKTYDVGPHARFTIWVNREDPSLAATEISAVITSTSGTPIVVERAMYLSRPGRPFDAGHESAGVTAASPQWFLAEGATGSFFDLFLLLANPGTERADVEITFLLPDGTNLQRFYTVPASSRVTLWIDKEDPVLADTAVSTTVRSTNGVPVIVERAMWWPDGGWYEAHNAPGATVTGTRWRFADGEVDRSRNLETYVLIANTSAVPGNVGVSLLFEDGTVTSRLYEWVAAGSRLNVPVGEVFPEAAGRRFGVTVESYSALSGEPPPEIVVERAMYWDAYGQRWAAGANALATRLQ